MTKKTSIKITKGLRIYRATFTKAGERHVAEKWYCEFQWAASPRRVPAFADKSASIELARNLHRLVQTRESGAGPDPMLAKWLDAIPATLRARLVDFGIISAIDQVATDTLLAHLEGVTGEGGAIVTPGYRQHLQSIGDTPAHVKETVAKVKRIIEGVGFERWRDLTEPRAAARVQMFLAGLKSSGEISATTFNYYARAMRAFASWLAGTLGAVSPMAGLKGLRSTEADQTENRALSPDEIRRLISAAIAAGLRYELEGLERARLYRFAYDTGMRPGAIRQLTVSSFDLDANPPTCTAAAATVKRRKAHLQVLRPAMAAEIAPLLANKLPDALAFRMPNKFKLASMFRADLADARAAWVDEAGENVDERIKRLKSDYLAAVDHQKRRANFYSIRHTHGTALGDAGVPQKDIQASLHHTRSATTDRYLKSGIAARQRAVNLLPDVAPVLMATGTDDAGKKLAVQLAVFSGQTASKLDLDGQLAIQGENTKTPETRSISRASGVLISEDDGTRTRNIRIDSPVPPSRNVLETQPLTDSPQKACRVACRFPTDATPENDTAGRRSECWIDALTLAPELRQLILAWETLTPAARDEIMGIAVHRGADQADDDREQDDEAETVDLHAAKGTG